MSYKIRFIFLTKIINRKPMLYIIFTKILKKLNFTKVVYLLFQTSNVLNINLISLSFSVLCNMLISSQKSKEQ